MNNIVVDFVLNGHFYKDLYKYSQAQMKQLFVTSYVTQSSWKQYIMTLLYTCLW